MQNPCRSNVLRLLCAAVNKLGPLAGPLGRRPLRITSRTSLAPSNTDRRCLLPALRPLC